MTENLSSRMRTGNRSTRLRAALTRAVLMRVVPTKVTPARVALTNVVLLGLCLIALMPTAPAQRRATYANPVEAGDFPDPSVIRVGRDYWASATTSEWGPEFPIL